ncbi:hypothetical protein AB0M28_09875 [Streptomyces sp. NPDC051940]|uniref:hypothetical protein n=1 Tax=Streptomyces sp. NPDC051940 TaxID=3155675 RepID=UPI003414C052
MGAAMLTACGTSPAEVVSSEASPSAAERPTPHMPEVVKKNWPPAVPQRGLTRGMVLPLEKYMVTYAQEVAVQQARDITEIRCMASFGFTDWETEPLGTSPPVAATAANMPLRYGVSDLEDARKYGQHPPQLGYESTPPPSREDPQAVEVLNGMKADGQPLTEKNGRPVPEDGCLGKVGRDVGNLDVSLVERLNGDSFTESQKAPTVLRAMSKWSACMKDKGYDVNTVWGISDRVGTTGDAASGEEVAITVADVECKTTTSLVQTWFDEEEAIQKRLIADNAPALEASRTKAAEVTATADRLIATAE